MSSSTIGGALARARELGLLPLDGLPASGE